MRTITLISLLALAGGTLAAASPTVGYASFAGGSLSDWVEDMKVDGAGNVYLAGWTQSSAVLGRAVQNRGKSDVLVVKLDSTGRNVQWAVTFGGSETDRGQAMALDRDGNVYVVGYTESTTFPVKSALDNSLGGPRDAFALKLNPQGQLVYSTYLGGATGQPCSCQARDTAWTVAADSRGRAWVGGGTYSADFPITSAPAYTPDYGEGFLAVLSPAGNSLEFSTYIGGREKYDIVRRVVLDAQERAYISGHSNSPSFVTTEGAFQRGLRGGVDYGDVYVALVDLTDMTKWLRAATFFGGSLDDQNDSLTLDGDGNVIVGGHTDSTDLPVADAIQSAWRGGADWGDAFVAKFSPNLKTRHWATYFGGSGDDNFEALTVDGGGNIYAVGWTESLDLQLPQGGFQNRAGQTDALIAVFTPDGKSLSFASFYGGGANEYFEAAAWRGAGQLWLGGATGATSLPGVSGNSAQSTSGGGTEGYFLRAEGFGAVSSPGDPTTVSAVVNAASYTAGAISPGEMVVVYGTSVGPSELTPYSLDGNGYFKTEVANTRVWFNNVAAPIVYAAAGQTAVVAPYTLYGATSAQVVVERNGVRSAPFAVQVADAVPGLFSANSSGKGQGAILNQDLSANGPSNGESVGRVVVLYGSGEGQSTPGGVDGRPGPGRIEDLPRPILPVSVTIGGKPAAVQYAGGAPGLVAGLFQVNAVIPDGLGAGDHEVVVKFGARETQRGLSVRVK